ncbi:MAG TPA: Rieske (2Fe-2S) protein, partial [Acidimicrobiales bacterium]|nr:Rieske (2Fe-2S) protein [Acidimicrobiales bacterium]
MSLLSEIADKISQVEALDDLAEALSGPVKSATSPDAIKQTLSGGWIGHQLHPMLTDVPLGAWLSATALDVLGNKHDAVAARRLVGIGIVASLPTAASGASDWVDTYGGEKRVGVVHALGNSAALVLQCASYRARRRGKRGRGVLLGMAGLGAAMGAGYLGGHLSYSLGVGVNHTAFEFPPEDWTDVAAEADLVDDQPVRADAGGVPVMVVRHRGAIRALSATCNHAGGPLDEGE